MEIGYFSELLALQYLRALSLQCLLSTHTHPVIFPSSVWLQAPCFSYTQPSYLPETPAHSSSMVSSQPLKLSMSESTMLLSRSHGPGLTVQTGPFLTCPHHQATQAPSPLNSYNCLLTGLLGLPLSFLSALGNYVTPPLRTLGPFSQNPRMLFTLCATQPMGTSGSSSRYSPGSSLTALQSHQHPCCFFSMPS